MTLRFEPGETKIDCSDLERSLAFYGDVLGFEAVETQGAGAIHMGCGGRPFLLLAVARSPLPRVTYCEIPAISFDLQVSDIEQAIAHFRVLGVAFEPEWQEGSDHVFIRDPNGLVIEILQG